MNNQATLLTRIDIDARFRGLYRWVAGGEQYGEYRVGASTKRAGGSLKVGGH